MSPSSAGEEEGANKGSATVTQTGERWFSVHTPLKGFYPVNMSLFIQMFIWFCRVAEVSEAHLSPLTF